MRRASNYAVRARRRFCDGKRVAPIDLVLSGKRSLEDWVETLNQERERQAQLGSQRATGTKPRATLEV